MDQSALHRRAERLATAWLATGCLVAVGVMVGVLGDAAAPLVSLAGLGGMITGIALHRPKPMSPWLGMAVAMLCFMAGGVLRVMCGTLGDMSSTRSILPDLATLPGYLLGALALARLVAVLLPDSDRLPAVIDSGAAAVAMFILAWVFVIEPLTHRPNVSATAVGLQLLYPVASVVMVSIAARLAFVTFSQNSRTLRLVFVSLCLSLLGDLLYLVADSGIAHVSSRWLDVPYLLAFTAFPAAMLHPDLAGVGSVRSSVRSISRRRAAFVTVAIAAPSLIVVLWTGHDTLDRWVLGPAVLLLLVLVAARMGHALVEASRHQARFAYLASHDELTGLPNRREIRRRLLDEGDAASMIAAVIDVDRFQLVNDTFDHDLGDALIRLVADRIAGLCGTDWVVGHAGGAQYLAIGAASEGPALFERLEHLRVKLADRYEVNGSEFRVTASIGVASEGGSERARLLRDADTAMYQAKARGGDCVVAFDARMHERSVRRLRLEHDLRGAIERNELEVYYQPLVQLPDESIRGFEALVRWHHPVLGAVAPLDFIPIAEDTGLIGPVGAWVLDRAVRQLATWRHALPGGNRLLMSVNVSPRQLRDPEFVLQVQRSLDRHDVPASRLVLEVTESLLMENPIAADAVLQQLRSVGAQIAIDDFGTGFSSLAYLNRFKIDIVKIDRAFVSNVDGDGSESSLVAAIVAMARALGLATVAEGIETDAQLKTLIDLGVSAGQGYRWSKPLPAGEVPALVERLTIRGGHLRVVDR